MARQLGWVRQFHAAEVPGSPPLVIFPHAGSGASSYRGFSALLSARFDVVIFQYPGRQDRVREAPAATLPELAAGAFAEFAVSEHNSGAPLTVFGHSMGAIGAFEFAHQAETAGIAVDLLAVSSAVAPSRVAELPPHPYEDDAILAHLANLEGTGAQVLASSTLMRMALPAMKADYRAFDAYSCGADVVVDADIVALGGVDDDLVTPGDLHAWSVHNGRGVASVTVFDGGHFYINDNTAAIADLLVGHRSTPQLNR